jgi:hypothetical protein
VQRCPLNCLVRVPSCLKSVILLLFHHAWRNLVTFTTSLNYVIKISPCLQSFHYLIISYIENSSLVWCLNSHFRIRSGNFRLGAKYSCIVCEKLRTAFEKYCKIDMFRTSYGCIWKPVNLSSSNLFSWFKVYRFMQAVTCMKRHWSCTMICHGHAISSSVPTPHLLGRRKGWRGSG